MISVGIDVSKGKSTVCAIKPYGEVLMTPRDFKHTKDDLDSLARQLSRFKEEIHIIMEATGNYHLPICRYLKSKDYMISIIVNRHIILAIWRHIILAISSMWSSCF